MRARLAGLAATLCAVATVAGCAAIPESSRVEVVGPRVSETTEAPVAPPPAGLDPLSVVRGFIQAAARQANRHAAARAYLTEHAKATWDDTGPVVVLADTFNTVYSTSPGDAQTDDYRQVLLRGQQYGELGPDGAFTANRGTVTPTMDLVRENGEWRINSPPATLHVLYSDFRTAYHSIWLRFVDQSRSLLVVDRRWILTQPSSSWPSRAVDLLLGGPSGAVKDGAVNLLKGAKIRTNVVLGDNDVLTVDLTNVPELTEAERRLAAAQIVASLSDFVAQKVRILVDGAPLVPSKPEWAAADAEPYALDNTVKPDLPALAIDNRRVVRAEGGEGIDGPAGRGEMPVESAAQSLDGGLYAIVVNDGSGPRLWVGPADTPQQVQLQATSMTRPTWRQGASAEVWTVINGVTGVGVLRRATGELQTFSVDVSDLAVKGRITELRLSRDGTRIAAVVDGALYVGVVAGSVDGTKIRNPRLLVGPGATQVADVDWRGRDAVTVATRGKDNPQVYEVTVDGLTWTAYENTNLTAPLTGIASAPGRPVLVADLGGLWFARDAGALWYSEGLSRGTDPFYAG